MNFRPAFIARLTPADSKCVPSWICRKFFQGSDIFSDSFTLQKTDKPGSIGNFC